jgi:predicted nucleic-acid-binding Zn-ribbon protein
MNEKEAKKCPKCGDEMTSIGRLSDGHAAVMLSDGLFSWKGKVIPFCCRNCGYIEPYKEMSKEKE